MQQLESGHGSEGPYVCAAREWNEHGPASKRVITSKVPVSHASSTSLLTESGNREWQ